MKEKKERNQAQAQNKAGTDKGERADGSDNSGKVKTFKEMLKKLMLSA